MSLPVTYRHCPTCGAGVGFVRLWFLGWSFAKWDCPSCGARLGFNIRRRTIVAIVSAPITALALTLAFNREWILSLLALAVSLTVWRLDSVRLIAPEEKRSAEARA